MIQSFTISALLDNLSMMAPELTLSACFLIVVCAVIAFRSPSNAKVIGAIALAGCSIAFISAAEQFWLLKGPYFPFGEMLILDRLSGFFNLFFLAGTIVIILASLASRPLSRYPAGEYYAILTGCALAMMILARSLDWLMFYLALETLSLGSYVLSGYTRDHPRAAEASMKYFVYGTVASGITLFGISYLYGLTGSLDIRRALTLPLAPAPATAALLMIFAGLGFKISLVPYHFWAPDVYEGAPTPVTAFLAVVSKAAGFAAVLRVFMPLAEDLRGPAANLVQQINWRGIFWAGSVVTMTWGNLLALRQVNLKRLLAYSSIAHAGYMAMGLAVLNRSSIEAILFYLVAYAIMNLGTFVALIYLENRTGSVSIQYYRGLVYRSPLLAIVLAILLFSLTGLPPTVGFIGKLLIFSAVIQAALSNPDQAVFYYLLALFGGLNTVISLYYYAGILKVMVLRGSKRTTAPMPSRADWEHPAINAAAAQELDSSSNSEDQPPAAGGGAAMAAPAQWRPAFSEGMFLLAFAIPTLWLGIFWEPLRAVIHYVLD